MVNELMRLIAEHDSEVGAAVNAEFARQRRNLELIASENIVSEVVMAAMGTVLTNKYAEGYPGKRYYGGCECVDVVENLAIERAKKLFGCDYANVQPHSGAQANMAVFIAMLKPGDTVMGMNLDHGGHLTHGSPVNFSGMYFNIVPYGVNDEGYIDYDELEERIGVTDQEPDYVIRDYELPFEIDEDMMIEELNCLCQMVDELPESVQKNIETLLMEYGNVRNLYEHFVTNQNPVL